MEKLTVAIKARCKIVVFSQMTKIKYISFNGRYNNIF